MAIVIELDVMLAKRKMKLNDLAAAIGITPQNLSVLKSGRAKAIRFSTLDAICKSLACSPGDILTYQPERSNQSSQNSGALNQGILNQGKQNEDHK
ncbi:MAG: helix-turn-helix transcriptional regulator [Alteromonadaceae bacterium]|nr:helix-turn-helix transcriptional regulator [Alteromonadaceae bacterium]